MNIRIVKLNRKEIIQLSLLCWFSFIVLSISSVNNFQILNVIGFISLMILPGFLTFILLKLSSLELWGRIGIILGFSVLELMTIGLFVNTFMPVLGIVNPLTKVFLLATFSLWIFSLLALVWFYDRKCTIAFKKFVFLDSHLDLFFAIFPVLFVILSILGSIRLNNGGDGAITLLTLILIGAYSALFLKYNQRIGHNVIPTALFLISLSILLMTSLRGWNVTGHDVQREFRVFQITEFNDLWSMQSYKDAYNACLSITILPTIFSKLLHLPDPYVFKVLFQLIFAVVPGMLYLTVKQYTTRFISILSVFYFISFPTFFGDMPMLNRQEIAFLFLSLMLYIIFKEGLPIKIRQYLFVIFGCGMVLSHYSTTYTIIAVFLFLLCVRPIARKIGAYAIKKRSFVTSAIETFSPRLKYSQNLITVPMVSFIMLFSFAWGSVLTDTASNSIVRVVRETIEVMKNNTGQDSRSGDVLYSLFSWKKSDPSIALGLYEEKVVAPIREESPEAFYEESLYLKYPVTVAPDNILPLTSLGKFIEDNSSIDVYSFNYAFRQVSAKLLQIFILLGVIAMLFGKNSFKRNLDTDFVLLAMGSLVLIFSQIALPVLSKEYGALRAFQQSLFFLSVFIVAGSFTVFWRNGKSFGKIFAGTLAITFFLSSTGVFTQLLGGYGPQLHLNNAGTYYDVYYLHDTEIAGMNWLESVMESGDEYQAESQSDKNQTKSGYAREIGTSSDIFPGLIRKDAFVYLGFANTEKGQATFSYNSDLVNYRYPVEFLDDNKNLIYNNGGSRIYR
jgi:uncharacterized membrane protein